MGAREDLRLCDGCLEMRHPAQFVGPHGERHDRCGACRVCAEPSIRTISAQPERPRDSVAELGHGRTSHAETQRRREEGKDTMATKHLCSKGCGRMLLPQHVVRHERKCPGPAQPAAKSTASTALVRARGAERVLRVVRKPGVSVLSADQVRARVEQLAQDCRTTLAVLEMVGAAAAAMQPGDAA